MKTYQQLLNELDSPVKALQARQTIIKEIEAITGRSLIVYAADIKKNGFTTTNTIEPMDKAGFSDLLNSLNGQPLDVFLQSPGGSVEATESIVNMLRASTSDIRFIIPHTAKSAATLLALSGNSILMDYRSELGPIDPQVIMILENGIIRNSPAQTILDGFNKARTAIEERGGKVVPAYLPLLNKYDLHLLEICQNATDLSKKLAAEWLTKYMFNGDDTLKERAENIANHLSNHNDFLSHGRPITLQHAIDIGLIVENLSENPEVQARVWELYCNYEITFERSAVVKIFENSKGISWQRLNSAHMAPPQQPAPGGPIHKGSKNHKNKKR